MPEIKYVCIMLKKDLTLQYADIRSAYCKVKSFFNIIQTYFIFSLSVFSDTAFDDNMARNTRVRSITFTCKEPYTRRNEDIRCYCCENTLRVQMTIPFFPGFVG